MTDELLSMLDVLVDGRFVEELKDISLRFRGSSNQRLIDMKKTLASGEIVLLPDLDRKRRSSIRRNHPISMVTMAQRIEALRTEKGHQPPRAGGGAGTAPPVHRKV